MIDSDNHQWYNASDHLGLLYFPYKW